MRTVLRTRAGTERARFLGTADAAPSVPAGLTEKHGASLAGLGINTIKDTGANKYFALANDLAPTGVREG